MARKEAVHRTRNVATNGVDYSHLLPGLRVGGTKGICTGCGMGFSSDSTFDRHQKFNKDTGELECRHPSEFGFVEREGFWGMSDPKTRGLGNASGLLTGQRDSDERNENE